MMKQERDGKRINIFKNIGMKENRRAEENMGSYNTTTGKTAGPALPSATPALGN